MKLFLKFFAIPLLIATVASVLYIVDCIIAPIFVSGASFMWVAFALWTVFYGAKVKDRIKGLIGVIIGFASAILMNLITSAFTLNILSVSLSCLIGVFLVNGIVMYMNHLDKLWLSSVTGAFVGIFLTFSGLGVGLSPLSNVSNAFLMLGILIVYAILGLICGYISITVTNIINKKLAQLNAPVISDTKEDEKQE